MNHWSKDLGQRGAIEFRLLLVNRGECAVNTTGNISLYPTSSEFEDSVGISQMCGLILDLLVTVAELNNPLPSFMRRKFLISYSRYSKAGFLIPIYFTEEQ